MFHLPSACRIGTSLGSCFCLIWWRRFQRTLHSDLIVCVRAASDRNRRLLWLITAGFSMGFGIWAMHFIAMLAVEIPIPLRFRPPAHGTLRRLCRVGQRRRFPSGGEWHKRSGPVSSLGGIVLGRRHRPHALYGYGGSPDARSHLLCPLVVRASPLWLPFCCRRLPCSRFRSCRDSEASVVFWLASRAPWSWALPSC